MYYKLIMFSELYSLCGNLLANNKCSLNTNEERECFSFACPIANIANIKDIRTLGTDENLQYAPLETNDAQLLNNEHQPQDSYDCLMIIDGKKLNYIKNKDE